MHLYIFVTFSRNEEENVFVQNIYLPFTICLQKIVFTTVVGPDLRFWMFWWFHFSDQTNLISEDQDSSVEDLVDDADVECISESELGQQQPGVNLIYIWFNVTDAPKISLSFVPSKHYQTSLVLHLKIPPFYRQVKCYA
jgi:hypothetical protein